jgi:putative flavoprotein involved in K+ transport
MSSHFDVVVIGAGSAGLATSGVLTQVNIEHILLEGSEVGQSWRSQRWDSFTLNTPNWCNGLPGMDFYPSAPDDFADCQALLRYFAAYVDHLNLPVRSHTRVDSVSRREDGRFIVRSDGGDIIAKAVVLATGGMNRPRVPRISESLPKGLTVLSAGSYRNPEALPQGAVLIVGSGQSGCQIVEELLEAGRRVYLCVSRVARVVRAYRGREILSWWRDMGFLDTRLDELKDPSIRYAAQPQVSGRRGGHTISLQSLARDGARLIGRVEGVEGHKLKLNPNVRECIRFADDRSRAFKADVDVYIEQAGLDVAPETPDPGEPDLPDLMGSDAWDEVDLRMEDITSVIWCTGFDADWRWVEIPVFDDRGRPVHTDGISQCPGLYFMGLPWLSSRKSGILYGLSDDATRIVQDIERNVLVRKAG